MSKHFGVCGRIDVKMENVDYKTLGKALYEKYPDVAMELIEGSRPIINNFEFIPRVGMVLENLKEYPPATTRERTDYNRLFVLVSVRLFDPDSFNGTRKYMRSGLRKYLSHNLGCSPTRVSELYREAKDLLKLYRSFRNEAIALFDEINFQYSGFREPLGFVRFIN